ncbi:glycosyltransferase family 2 protein [Caulobacter mirabilis]|uniref:Glycosyl transferase n=1 Tax=Caulobacter mirabilis TaxID=69666 RepID=A0A2D2AXI2_9CAUL|nr:glycosyltransferase family A protein [Caulobacter mirabilis]ATQ42693.1 glycosyl transferase [Caulobacter mirabilis]
MTAQASEWTTENAAWAHARPMLSVLIPTYRDDPVLLLAQLNREAVRAEVIVLDDGSGDADLALRIAEAVEAMRLPARFVRLTANEGRARGRNRLVGHARAERLLFLDADMAPDSETFLRAWLDLVDERDPAVAFGGFSLDQTPKKAEHALHRAMALKSDCLPAAERALAPEKHVFTSNLLVRRDVFDRIAFDEAFAGWGWEDVEWAMRVTQAYEIVHADIPASHLGLDAAPAMARKYEQSAVNFARVVAAHREVVETYPSYRAARLLKAVPLRNLWRPILKVVALAEGLPLGLRDLAMRTYRAALYAEAV